MFLYIYRTGVCGFAKGGYSQKLILLGRWEGSYQWTAFEHLYLASVVGKWLHMDPVSQQTAPN